MTFNGNLWHGDTNTRPQHIHQQLGHV